MVVAPPGAVESRLLLARATTDAQRAAVGNQSGERVFLFLYTDNFWRDYERYRCRIGPARDDHPKRRVGRCSRFTVPAPRSDPPSAPSVSEAQAKPRVPDRGRRSIQESNSLND